MRLNSQILIAVLALTFVPVSAQTQRLAYPPTRRVDQRDEYHGIKVADPYRWLEEMNSAETRRWVRSQDELTTQLLQESTAREALRRRLATLSTFASYGSPGQYGDRIYFSKTEAGASQRRLFVQDSAKQEPRLLFDPAASFKNEPLSLMNYWPTEDGQVVAFTLARNQSRWQQLGVIDAAGRLLPDRLSGFHSSNTSLAWTSDRQGFFYARFDEPGDTEAMKAIVKNQRIYYHRLGTRQAEDELVYAYPTRPDILLGVQISDDGRYLIITARDGGSVKNSILCRDLSAPAGKVMELLKDTAAYTFLGNTGKRFVFYTDQDAPRGRFISVDISRPQPAHWQTIVPQAKEAMAAGSLVGGNAVGMFGDRLLAMYWADGQPIIRLFDLRGRLQHTLKLPVGSSLWGISGSPKRGNIFYRLLTLDNPATTYRLNLRTGRASLFRRAELPFNGDGYVIRQVFYRSPDGTRVPMFIAHKKGIVLDGKNPTMMYGYGAFAWNSFLWYQPNVLVWLEMGGIYALPRLRGGGEYGEEWHRAGMKTNEQNSINDYLAAADWLITNRYTSAARLVANGGSASAPTAAAAVIQRPDLFAAALIDIPFLDMLRYDQFTASTQFIQELGSPAQANEFRALYAYSPYHNLKPGSCYPPTLVRVGELDETAVPAHGYKFIAALQAAQACGNPALLKVMWGAGHNFGATTEQTIESHVDGLVFLQRALQLDQSIWRPVVGSPSPR